MQENYFKTLENMHASSVLWGKMAVLQRVFSPDKKQQKVQEHSVLADR
jgi:hypothetical protein